MSTWAVLATGPSMSQRLANSIQDRTRVVAVSDAYKLAPWADVLVSADLAWWRANPDASDFAGQKFSGFAIDVPKGTAKFEGSASGDNSGLLGIKVAVSLGATKILLCGFDMGGAHFFGAHKPPLKNTQPHRFEVFKKQFKHYQPRGVQIVNCTPNSQLFAYPRAPLEDCLSQSAAHAA